MSSDRLVFHGAWNGTRFVADETVRHTALGAMYKPGDRLVQMWEREKKVRTVKQNSRYWSLLEPVAREVLSQRQQEKGLLPFSKEQTHALLAGAFVGHEEVGPPCKCHGIGLVYKSTKNLTTVEFSKFTDETDRWLAEQGCDLQGVDRYTEGL